MNELLLGEILPNESPELLTAYNTAFNEAIARQLFNDSKRGTEVAEMSDAEFLHQIEISDRQPINPVAIAREALGYPEEAGITHVLVGLQQEYQKLIAQYEDNGVDGRSALRNATNIIGHTEAYIAGYSRQIGKLTNRILMVDPVLNAPARWLEKLWVPQEDEHDRLWALFMMGCREEDMEDFYADHSHHMQVGVHVPVESLTPTQLYLTQQEGTTDTSYDNISTLYGSALRRIPKTIQGDESRHARDYLGVSTDIVEVDPDLTVTSLEYEVRTFAMPGKEGIRDFDEKSKQAGITGILDPLSILAVQQKTFRRLGIGDRVFKSDQAKAAQEKLMDPNGDYGDKMFKKRTRQLEGLRVRAIEKARQKGQLLPAIIGITVVADPRTGQLSFPMAA